MYLCYTDREREILNIFSLLQCRAKALEKRARLRKNFGEALQEGKGRKYKASSTVELPQINPSFLRETMGRAIGFGAIIIVFAVLLPEVLRALEAFLLTFLDLATRILENLGSNSNIFIR